MPVNRTVSISITLDGDQVTLSRKDWDRLLTFVGDRDVSYNTQLSLKPKNVASPKMKRGPYKKRKKVTEK